MISLPIFIGSKVKLEWGVRYRIALGTAKGLQYLHEGCQRRIIHRDIKAANILLTEEFEAKVTFWAFYFVTWNLDCLCWMTWIYTDLWLWSCKMATRELDSPHHIKIWRHIWVYKPLSSFINLRFQLGLFFFMFFFFWSKSYLCLLLQFIDSYLAPEFLLHGIVDEKTDVFAFGVLLLELVTGRRALDYSQQSLVLWVSSCIAFPT